MFLRATRTSVGLDDLIHCAAFVEEPDTLLPFIELRQRESSPVLPWQRIANDYGERLETTIQRDQDDASILRRAVGRVAMDGACLDDDESTVPVVVVVLPVVVVIIIIFFFSKYHPCAIGSHGQVGTINDINHTLLFDPVGWTLLDLVASSVGVCYQ